MCSTATSNRTGPREILACIVAMGTNMGLWKMAEVSGLCPPSLAGASRNSIRRLETVRNANNTVAIRPASTGVPPLRHPGGPALQQRRPAHGNADRHSQCAALAEVFRPAKRRERLHAGGQSRTDQRQGRLAPTSTRAIMCSTCCTTTPQTSSRNGIRPTRTAPTRSTSGFCTLSAITSRRAVGTCTRKWTPWSDSSNRASTKDFLTKLSAIPGFLTKSLIINII